MRIFAGIVRMMKDLRGSLARKEAPAISEEQASNDRLVLARIAHAYPELIVAATEVRDYRV